MVFIAFIKRVFYNLLERTGIQIDRNRRSKMMIRSYGVSFLSGCEFLGPESMHFGKNVGIGSNSFFSAEKGKIVVGNNTSFNRNVHINASVCGEIIIGDLCLIGPNVVMRTADHRFDDITIPIRQQGHYCQNIIIEDDVWIGANVVIVGGVTIGKGAVIGAGAVVTKNIPSLAIALGVPARIVKYRGNHN